jgi:hypothetical protein
VVTAVTIDSRIAGEQSRVAALLRQREPGQDRPAGGRVDQGGGEALVDAQPTGLGEAADASEQDLHSCLEGRRRRSPARFAVHQRVKGWVGQPEFNRQVPACAQVVNRVVQRRLGLLIGDEGRGS